MNKDSTHWENCYLEHQTCAWAEIDRLRAKLAEAKEREIATAQGVEWLRKDSARIERELEAKLAKCEQERDVARANYQFMVDRAANEKLDGYRELGQRAADAENRAVLLEAAIRDAPHSYWCSLNEGEHTGECNCWKRDALEGK